MTELDLSRREVRELDGRDARFLAWDIPRGAYIVALVCESGEAERSATVVDAIATSIARRREHTLVLSAEGRSPLDELLGGVDSQGLPAALRGRARLTDVAVQRLDRPFVYLPAGDDPEAMRALLADELLVSFVRRVRERGGTLFLVVSEETDIPPGIRGLLDGCLTLGEAELPPGPEELELFGRIRFDESSGSGHRRENRTPTAGAIGPDEDAGTESVAAADPEPIPPEPPEAGPQTAVATAPHPEPGGRRESSAPETEVSSDEGLEEPVRAPAGAGGGSWTRHRSKAPLPLARVGVGAGVLGVVFLAWWWFASGAGSSASPNAATMERAVAAPAAEPTRPGPIDPASAARGVETAPELPFSVLIASYADRADADERVSRLRASSAAAGGLFFVAPTPVRDVVYHRVFAGALPSETDATALMDGLVESGHKDDASPWHVRPARLAFDLGLFADRAGADARVEELRTRGIPGYVLPASLDGRPIFQVYGGAYENERASLPMAEILAAAGEPASLIARHGGADASPTS